MTPRRVLVARREGAGGDTGALLRAGGFEPVAVSLIEIAPPADPGPLQQAVTRLFADGYDWVAFTSVPAVRAVVALAAEFSDSGPALAPRRTLSDLSPGTRFAAVGPGTAAALAACGVEVALVPAGGSARALAASWPAGGGTVLLPRSDIAPSLLPDALRANGYDVDAVTAYRTVSAPLSPDCAAELAAGGFVAVALASGSAARALARYPVGGSTVVVAIGQSTAAAASAAGLTVAAVAAEPSPAGLMAALRLALDEPREPPTAAPYPRSETLPACPTGP